MAHKITWLNKEGMTGRSWNPLTGCSKISAGCDNCYAERMSKRLAGRFGYPEVDPFAVTFHPDKIPLPMTWKKPSMIFTCSMSDLFHRDVAQEWVDAVLSTIQFCDWHTFLILTKRPEFARKYTDRFANLPNLWLGVTVENQGRANQRIPILQQLTVSKRFLSVEPMLEQIDVRRYLHAIDWVICGGETGQKARPFNTQWPMHLREQCQLYNVPFFFKSYGSNSNQGDTGLLTKILLDNDKKFPL